MYMKSSIILTVLHHTQQPAHSFHIAHHILWYSNTQPFCSSFLPVTPCLLGFESSMKSLLNAIRNVFTLPCYIWHSCCNLITSSTIFFSSRLSTGFNWKSNLSECMCAYVCKSLKCIQGVLQKSILILYILYIIGALHMGFYTPRCSGQFWFRVGTVVVVFFTL